MTIEKLTISYPDFKAGTLMNPEEFDQNNSDIKSKVDEIIDVTNEHNTSIDNLSKTRSLIFAHTSSGFQTISTNSASKVILLQSEQVDSLGEFSSNRFTANEGGVYLVRTFADWGSDDGSVSTTFHRLYINGIFYSLAFVLSVSYNARYTHGSYMIQLNAGDYLEFFIEQLSGSNKTLDYASMQVSRMS